MTDTILQIAKENQKRAFEVIEKSNIIPIWESVGAEVNLVGSLRTGLLVKNKDIDLHVYSSPLDIQKSFRAMSKLAQNPAVIHIEYTNLIDTDEKCIEWHAQFRNEQDDLWKFDIIHILKGSKYDGFFENIAERINAVATPQQRETIMRLKYETPETEKIAGIEYYMAVISNGVKSYSELLEWRKSYTYEKGLNWIP